MNVVSGKIKPSKIVIVGGGLAGLISSLLLNRAGYEVTLIEKKRYPFHRVCGEYISNEVRPFLKSLGIDVDSLCPSQISKLAISSVSGRSFNCELDLGGFGISRFTLDNYLYEKASRQGVNFILGQKANQLSFRDNCFESTLDDATKLSSDFVIAAHGKRSNLDKSRAFFYRRSPYIGVKYHIKTDFQPDTVQLDNFLYGYCGTVKIENDRYCLCYLSRKENLKRYGNIEEMERTVLWQNPILRDRFKNSEFIFSKPEVINEISFEQKTLIEDHVLFCGDSAGMISPLCGNGMAMAVHSAKLLCEAIIQYGTANRELVEKTYITQWNDFFAQRLLAGRLTQKLFGSKLTSELALLSLLNIKPLSNFIIKKTHGTPF